MASPGTRPCPELLSFAVVSDIHGDTQGFERAVRDQGACAPGLDALVVNGDFLDLGREEDYRRFGACLESLSPILPPHLALNIGNHEFYLSYGTGPSREAEHGALLERFLRLSRRERVYDDEWLGGCHLIHLGSQSTYNDFFDPSPVRAYLLPDQLEWLSAKLEEDGVSGRPVFVFLHQPLDGVLPWTEYYGDDTAESAAVLALLGAHPEAILFSAHSHQTWYAPGWNCRRLGSGFTAIDSSSVARPTLIDRARGVEVDFDNGSSEGLVVAVFEDEVLVRARNFASGEWIPRGEVVVPLGAPTSGTAVDEEP